MGRILILITFIILVLPGAFPPGESEEGPVPIPRALKSLQLSDFSQSQRTNLSLRSDGGVQLAETGNYTAYPERTLCSAANVQEWTAVACAPDGTFLVVWADGRSGASDIYGRRYDSKYDPIGSELAVSTASGDQKFPDIAVDSRGNYLVGYAEYNGYGHTDVYVQRLDSEGKSLGNRLKLNAEKSVDSHPSMAMAPNDSCFVVWDCDPESTDSRVCARLIDSSGNLVSDELTLRADIVSSSHSDVVARGDAFLVATWIPQQQNVRRIVAQEYHPNGTRKGDEVLIVKKEFISSPSLAIFSDGGWAVTWVEEVEFPEVILKLQMYDATNTKVGGERIVAPDRVQAERPPSLAVTALDALVVTWRDRRGQNNDGDIFARVLGRDGQPLGAELAVDVKTGSQWAPDVAVGPDDDLYFAWADYASRDVAGRKYSNEVFSSGELVTPDIMAPAGLKQWWDITAGITLRNETANSIAFDYSTDGGAAWLPVPSNGSIAYPEISGKIRLRARFATTDNRTSPILHNITLRYSEDGTPPVNRPPRVWAGPDIEAFKNTTVILAAAGTDEDGDVLTYVWVQLEGAAVQLNGQGSPSVSFVPASTGIYRFRVVASDGRLESLPAFVNVTVRNRVPTVTAPADLAFREGERVFLNASGFDPDGDVLSFTWTQVSEGPKYLDNFTGPSASFIADKSGKFTFRVVASDGEAQSPPALFNLTVYNTGDQPPSVVTGGDISCFRRSRVQLNCTGSDPEGSPLTFTWTQVEGAIQTLSDSKAQSPWFFANQSGTFKFKVTASDGTLSSLPVFINVTVVNRPPSVTVDGTIVCHRNDRVFLRANGSDPDGDTLTFTWNQTSEGISYLKNQTGQEASFVASRSGRYQFRVVCNDGEADSAPGLVELTVLADGEDVVVPEFPLMIVLLFLALIIAFIALLGFRRRMAKRY